MNKLVGEEQKEGLLLLAAPFYQSEHCVWRDEQQRVGLDYHLVEVEKHFSFTFHTDADSHTVETACQRRVEFRRHGGDAGEDIILAQVNIVIGDIFQRHKL